MAKKKTTKKEVHMVSYPVFKENRTGYKKVKYQDSYKGFTDVYLKYPSRSYHISAKVVKGEKGYAFVQFDLRDIKNDFIRVGFLADSKREKYLAKFGSAAQYSNINDAIVIHRVD